MTTEETKKMVDDAATLCLDSMSWGARLELFTQIARSCTGPMDFPGTPVSFLPICSFQPVEPGNTVPLSTQCQRRFLPRRLVILDQTVSRNQVTPVYEDKVIRTQFGIWWWRRIVEETTRVLARYEDHAETLDVPRRAWEVDGIFVGNNVQFENSGIVGGDAFGPDGKMDFTSAVCESGMTITVGVRHALPVPVPFRGIIVGERPPATTTRLS